MKIEASYYFLSGEKNEHLFLSRFLTSDIIILLIMVETFSCILSLLSYLILILYSLKAASPHTHIRMHTFQLFLNLRYY